MIDVCKNKVEQRKAVPDEIIPGFYAIHYAAMFGNELVVAELLPYEAKETTK
jgi:ankyrin repeat protein